MRKPVYAFGPSDMRQRAKQSTAGYGKPVNRSEHHRPERYSDFAADFTAAVFFTTVFFVADLFAVPLREAAVFFTG